jgi:hypothetical protein
MEPKVQSESVRMLRTSRAKRLADNMASMATLGPPDIWLCFTVDARWSEVAAKFHAMCLQVSCEPSFPSHGSNYFGNMGIGANEEAK